MSILHQDLRYAARDMRRNPGFTAVIIATLALGIGANAAIFTVVDAVLLRPLPYEHTERIVTLENSGMGNTVSEPEFMDYRRGIAALSKLAAYTTGDATIGASGEALRARGSRVSWDFFDIMGSRPEVGRTFAPDEFSTSSKVRVTVLSHAFWQQQFAGDPRVIGRTMQINGTAVTIIGVMPAGFAFPSERTSFWTPWRLNPDSLWTRNNHYLALVGQLAVGATAAQAETQSRTLNRQWMHDFPETYFRDRPISSSVTPLREHVVGATRPYLFALLGAVGFVLLIACVNVANLLLARGEARRKEFAIRAALGASRARVVRQLLTESSLLAVMGSVVGVALAWFGVRALVALAPAGLPRLDQLGVDYRIVLFTALITVVTGILFGAVPAVRDTRGGATHTLRAGRTSGHIASGRARHALVVTEVALAVIMLTGSALLVRSLIKLQAIDLGFDPSHVLTMQLTLPPRTYNDTTADDLWRGIVERVAAMPGVEGAAFDGSLPLSGDDSDWSILVDGHVVKTIAEAPSAKPQQVTADYFKAMSIRIVRGRAFTAQDRIGSPPVALINETMAKKLWPDVDPIGHTLKMFNPSSPWVTIIGVVRDVKSRGFLGTVPPTMIFPLAQSGASAYGMPSTVTLVVRAVGDPAVLAPPVRAIVRAADARVPIAAVATMDQVVGNSIASRRFTTALLGGFAALALALAGIGIYGVIAYGVSQRTFEMGVRIALGASANAVLRLVMSDAMRMAVTGIALGLVCVPVVARLLRSLLVGVGALDVPALATVTVALLVVATCASAVPARRATAVSPTDALRNG